MQNPNYYVNNHHLATKFIPNEAWIQKFRTAYVFAKNVEKHGTRGSCMSFDAF